MNSQALLYPMVAHVAYAASLYALLTVARAPAVWHLGRAADGGNPWAAIERRISANLSNQFEWPLFFHLACLLLMRAPTIASWQWAMAWGFIAGRLLHGAVHIGTTNVRLRGVVFMINFVAVLALWAGLIATAGDAAAH